MSYTPPDGNNVVLVFATAYAPPLGDVVELNFNRSPALEKIHLSVDVVLDDASASLIIQTVNRVAISVQLDDVVGAVELAFSAGVWRGLGASRRVRFAGSDALDRHINNQFRQAAKLNRVVAQPVRNSYPVIGVIGWPWLSTKGLPSTHAMAWVEGYQKQAESGGNYNCPAHQYAGWQLVHRTADSKSHHSGGAWGLVRPFSRAVTALFEVGSSAWGGFDGYYGIASVCHAVNAAPWQVANAHPWFFRPTFPYFPYQPDVYVPSSGLIFKDRYVKFRPSTRYRSIGVIIMSHDLHVRRISDGAPIAVLAVSIQFDIDSWAWGCTLSVASAQALSMMASDDGMPCPVEVQIDNNIFSFIIETTEEDVKFSPSRFSAAGRSLLASLASPELARSYAEPATKLAAQLIEQELAYTGWGVSYHASLSQLFTSDWLVGGGAWSYQDKSPVDAIATIAKAIGARAYADRNNQIIHIAPRYPVSPWLWHEVSNVLSISNSLVAGKASKLLASPNYNQVIVSGQTHGVLVSAVRQGSAGDKQSPMITDNLITHVSAGRERARNVLSASGRQAQVSVRLPVNDVTGVIEPGTLVTLNGDQSWRGLVTSLAISASHANAYQSIEIERRFS